MEINYLANKYTFMNNMIVEQTTPAFYNFNNSAIVTIQFEGDDGDSYVSIGKSDLGMLRKGQSN